MTRIFNKIDNLMLSSIETYYSLKLIYKQYHSEIKDTGMGSFVIHLYLHQCLAEIVDNIFAIHTISIKNILIPWLLILNTSLWSECQDQFSIARYKYRKCIESTKYN